jgi:DNA-binding transcriptional MerR regulator/quercetin dioxygenase-like cupin family protein
MTVSGELRHHGSATNGNASPAAPHHRIGAAARQAGVSPSALRQWERQGLVRPARSRAGYRLYSDADLEQLRRIRRMRDDRVNPQGIRRLLSTGAVGSDGQSHAGGGQLRSLRRRRGLSLRAAASLTGLSPSFISALERDAAGASVSSLKQLTEAYGVTMLDLFGTHAPAARHVRPEQRPVLELEGRGVRIEQLALGARLLEPQLFVLAPGAGSDGSYTHAGEELLYVMSGALTVWVGERERYRLRAGDSLCFPSTLSHRWRNRAGGETRLLWINTPPTF